MKRILVSRNIDCNSITPEEFANAMRNDFEVAREIYVENYTDEYVNGYVRLAESIRNSKRNSLMRYAEKKWKTPKKRNEYVNKQMKSVNISEPYYSNITWFDFKTNPSLMSSLAIEYAHLDDASLKKAFEILMQSDWFKAAKGWELTIDTNENSWSYNGRPSIKMIFDEETQNKWNKMRDDLAKDIARFYAGSNYTGD